MVNAKLISTGDNINGHGQTEKTSSLNDLLTVATTVLRQAVDLANVSLSSDDQLTFQSTYIPGSTIGKHLRHATDHFNLLLDGISSPAPHEFSYDKRNRNTPMESSRASAYEVLQNLISRLEETVPKYDLDESLNLDAVTPYLQVFKSTFGRELWFVALHAVHHWSMIRVIAGEMNIKLEDTFGIAPSTLIYHRNINLTSKPKI